ncbi:hypothetical protein [Brevibacillus borstelensis]|uniref:hypothetical protein n=1 Tax=Brevibacillus borstelensis TaxID=45462 RepID=UPI00203CF213|nr:hypothetical protein [Brevibacillus borstelensis]MCM3473689.1 hypothetical protein [Brevibacillus borstelensis]MED1855150.1 hypothetical protein [Brevibacillus borstelensis]
MKKSEFLKLRTLDDFVKEEKMQKILNNSAYIFELKVYCLKNGKIKKYIIERSKNYGYKLKTAYRSYDNEKFYGNSLKELLQAASMEDIRTEGKLIALSYFTLYQTV